MYRHSALSGLVVLVTGASSGIGRATVENLLHEGALVVANARGEERLNIKFRGEREDNVARVLGNCADPKVCKEMTETAKKKWGKIDTLVANAGGGFFGSILDYSDFEVENLVLNNILGTIFPIRATLPTLKLSNRPDIVIVSSAAGYRGYANEAVYAATKHAQVGLAGSLDRELSKLGIRVSLVNPAGVKTSFALGQGRDHNSSEMSTYMDPEDVAQVITVILKVPRSVRTQNWNFWSISQES